MHIDESDTARPLNIDENTMPSGPPRPKHIDESTTARPLHIDENKWPGLGRPLPEHIDENTPARPMPLGQGHDNIDEHQRPGQAG
jgi:hypothetical protein